jgi:glutathione synthase/RimK-type ligase-like ATP-grasp enzyme
MKHAFKEYEVKSAPFYMMSDLDEIDYDEINYPIIAKRNYGSRGNGMRKLNSPEELEDFFNSDPKGYYFEEYQNLAREYRLHVTEDGCFYACRKMIKGDTPEDQRWFRNDSNCTWFLEDNEGFNKPSNWSEIEAECVKALKAVGLDFGACDVRVSSNTQEDGTHKFSIIEINSAPSFGEITAQKYIEMLPELLRKKRNS